MVNVKYAAFVALDPFFDVVMRGLAGAVDGDHYFEAIADDAVFEYRYVFPGFPTKIVGRNALMALYSGYGDSTILHSGDALIVHRSQEPGPDPRIRGAREKGPDREGVRQPVHLGRDYPGSEDSA